MEDFIETWNVYFCNFQRKQNHSSLSNVHFKIVGAISVLSGIWREPPQIPWPVWRVQCSLLGEKGAHTQNHVTCPLTNQYAAYQSHGWKTCSLRPKCRPKLLFTSKHVFLYSLNIDGWGFFFFFKNTTKKRRSYFILVGTLPIAPLQKNHTTDRNASGCIWWSIEMINEALCCILKSCSISSCHIYGDSTYSYKPLAVLCLQVQVGLKYILFNVRSFHLFLYSSWYSTLIPNHTCK